MRKYQIFGWALLLDWTDAILNSGFDLLTTNVNFAVVSVGEACLLHVFNLTPFLREARE